MCKRTDIRGGSIVLLRNEVKVIVIKCLRDSEGSRKFSVKHTDGRIETVSRSNIKEIIK